MNKKIIKEMWQIDTLLTMKRNRLYEEYQTFLDIREKWQEIKKLIKTSSKKTKGEK